MFRLSRSLLLLLFLLLRPDCLNTSHGFTIDQITTQRATRHASAGTTPVVLFARQKKNKYASFSNADKLAKDPLEQMMEDSARKLQEMEQDEKIRKNLIKPEDLLKDSDTEQPRQRDKILFPDTRNINPYDPATYGYTELGTILGPHGVQGQIKVAGVTDFPERLCTAGMRHMKYPNRRSPRSVKLLSGKAAHGNAFIVTLEGIGDRDSAARLKGCVLYAREEERPDSIDDDEFMVNDLVGLDVFLAENEEEEEEEEGDVGAAAESLEEEKTKEPRIANKKEQDGSSNVGSNDGDDGDDDDEGESRNRRFVGKIAGIVLAEEMCAIPELGQDLLEVSLPRGPGGTQSANDVLVLIPLVPQIVPTVDIADGCVYVNPPSGLLDLTYVREEKFRIRGFLPPGRS